MLEAPSVSNRGCDSLDGELNALTRKAFLIVYINFTSYDFFFPCTVQVPLPDLILSYFFF